jgi:fluoroacetyl-CoA thioesterase
VADMKNIFNEGDVKQYRMVVSSADVAAFHGRIVHEVCSTFALTREIEWTTRQFVLDIKDEDEEGIGTFVTLNHKGPAFVGEEITIYGKLLELKGHELICSYEAKVGDRLVADGRTGQKIFKKEKLAQLFASAKK